MGFGALLGFLSYYCCVFFHIILHNSFAYSLGGLMRRLVAFPFKECRLCQCGGISIIVTISSLLRFCFGTISSNTNSKPIRLASLMTYPIDLWDLQHISTWKASSVSSNLHGRISEFHSFHNPRSLAISAIYSSRVNSYTCIRTSTHVFHWECMQLSSKQS